MAIPTKTCRMCERELPLDEDFFHRDINNSDGFKSQCKSCRNERATYEKERVVDDAFARLEAKGIAQLTQVVEGGSKVPHAAEVYQCIMQGFGGPQLFAQHLIACYFNPQTSQMIKAKILQTVIGLAVKASDSGMIKLNLEDVPTEELHTMLQSRISEAVRQQTLRLHQDTDDARAVG